MLGETGCGTRGSSKHEQLRNGGAQRCELEAASPGAANEGDNDHVLETRGCIDMRRGKCEGGRARKYDVATKRNRNNPSCMTFFCAKNINSNLNSWPRKDLRAQLLDCCVRPLVPHCGLQLATDGDDVGPQLPALVRPPTPPRTALFAKSLVCDLRSIHARNTKNALRGFSLLSA